ncbi:MAG: acyl-CoA-binding protein [Nevskia sp.]|nr:acyl-CoA-binding protein [Nevskia sp.]
MKSAAKNLKARFEQAQQDVRTLSRRPRNEDLLSLYSLFKQGSAGDVAGSRPGFLDLVGRAKFDAWAKLKGTAPEAAMQSYIDKVAALLKTHK